MLLTSNKQYQEAKAFSSEQLRNVPCLLDHIIEIIPKSLVLDFFFCFRKNRRKAKKFLFDFIFGNHIFFQRILKPLFLLQDSFSLLLIAEFSRKRLLSSVLPLHQFQRKRKERKKRNQRRITKICILLLTQVIQIFIIIHVFNPLLRSSRHWQSEKTPLEYLPFHRRKKENSDKDGKEK